MPRVKRYAAGRARALGVPTRGTTAPGRLRRVERWLAATYGGLLRASDDPLGPLVVDLGYGASPVTTLDLARRLPLARVVGLEIDPERVAAAQAASGPRVRFARGGFELAGLRPVLVRAMNVLRQYDEAAARSAWTTLQAGLADGGVLVEGTCDEAGRIGSWVALGAGGPRTLTLSADVQALDRPATLAERLPKALIHHNVAGEPVHALLQALDDAWLRAPSLHGPRQRWVAACAALDWPRAGDPRRASYGELTVPWSSVAPASEA